MKTTIKKAKVSFEFQKMSPNDVATFGEGTVRGLTNNRDMPSPPVALATATAQVAAVRATLGQISSGNKTAGITQQLAQQATALVLSIIANGHYVEDLANVIAAGDVKRAEQLILNAGFKLKKQAAPRPRDFSVADTGVGWVHLRAAKAGAKKAESHLWRVGTTDAKGKPPGTVRTYITLEADVIITDLASGTVLAAQHASVLAVTRTKKTSAAATEAGAMSTPIAASKAHHPAFSYATSDPYHWTDFIYVVVP